MLRVFSLRQSFMCRPPLRLGARRRSTYKRIETNVLHLSNVQESHSMQKIRKKKKKNVQKRQGKTGGREKKSRWLKKKPSRRRSRENEDEPRQGGRGAKLVERWRLSALALLATSR